MTFFALVAEVCFLIAFAIWCSTSRAAELQPPFSFALLGPNAEKSLTVLPGAAFQVEAWEFSPLQSLVGVDWFFSAPSFALVGRDPSWSPFSDFLSQSPTLSGPQGGVLDDVGGGMDGLAILGRYSLIAPTASGSYLISATTLPGSGVVGPAPTFDESEWSSIVGLRVDVAPPPQAIPEPRPWAILLLIFTKHCKRPARINRRFVIAASGARCSA